MAVDVHFVTDQLATGADCGFADQVPGAIGELVDLGITHVIDLRLEWNDEAAFAEVAPDRIAYHWVPMDDAGQAEADATWDAVWAIAREAFESPDAKVLVHCHMGINRGPSGALAVLLGLGHDAAEALAMIRTARPIANTAYWADVLRWHDAIAGLDEDAARARVEACRAWRDDNQIDVRGIIRGIRSAEGTRYR